MATVSDRRCETAFLAELIEAGANVIRLNTAHQEVEDTRRVIAGIRSVSKTVAIMLDTKGPEIRTAFLDEWVNLRRGDHVLMGSRKAVMACPPSDAGGETLVAFSYDGVAETLPLGARILVDDGSLELIVTERRGKLIRCRAENDGRLANKKGVNLPGQSLDLPSLSERDHAFLELAAQENVDFVAHSFVRSAADVLAVQKVLDGHGASAKVIAKIENQQGIDELEGILDHCYGIMVARGDLGIEVDAARIPVIQKEIVRRCVERCRPVIVATQMLQSMMDSPRATRAEVSDVAHAVYDGADAVMLSGETAHGRFPLEAVRTMARVAEEVEQTRPNLAPFSPKTVVEGTSMYLARAAVQAVEDLPVKAILTDTTTGKTARYLSAFRGQTPVYTKCYSVRVARQLALSFGIHPEPMEWRPIINDFLRDAVADLLRDGIVERDEQIVVLAGNFGPHHGASFVEIATPARIAQETRGLSQPVPHCDLMAAHFAQPLQTRHSLPI